MSTKAVAYMRYSSYNQNEKSIDSQRNAIRAYCRQNSIELVGEYVDQAFTATNDNRPDFQRLMYDVERRPNWNTLIVFDSSRFARNINDAITYGNILADYDIELISVTQNFDNSDEGFISRYFCHLMDDVQSRKNRTATHAGLTRKALESGHCGGIPPLGYDVNEEGQLVINAEEAETVRKIFDMFEMNYSYTKMAERLNSEGRLTKARNPFTKNSFHELLHQEKYTGTYRWNKVRQKDSKGRCNTHAHKPIDKQVRVEGGCPQIISKERFQRVQETLAERARGKAGSKSNRHYMLSGMKVLRCAECGSCLVGAAKSSHGKTYTVYLCPKHKAKECSTKEIRTGDLDRMVANLIAKDLYQREDIPAISRQLKHNDSYKKLTEKKRGVERAINNVMRAIQLDPEEELVTRLKALSAEKASLERAIEASKVDKVGITPENIKAVCAKLRDYLIHSDDPDAKAYLQSAIKDISVSNDAVDIQLRIA